HGIADGWPRRLQVLIDGRSVYTPMVSNVDWSNLGITKDDIERIEVIRGPNAVAYGANAFTAAINIITKQPFEDRGVSVSGTVGAIDTKNLTARVGSAAGPVDFRMTAQYRSDDGFDDVNDHKRVRALSMRAGYSPSFRDHVEFHAGYSGGDFGAWGEPGDLETPPRERGVDSYYGMVHWQRTVSDRHAFHVQLYTNRYRWVDRYRVGPLSTYFGVPPAAIPASFPGQTDQRIAFGVFDGTAERTDLEFEDVFLPTDRWRVAWGGSLRVDRMESLHILDRTDPISDHSRRGFVNVEWRPAAGRVINGGVMVENNDMVGTYTSSRFGINQRIAPGHTVRASASHTARTPSMYENFARVEAEFNDGSDLALFRGSQGDLDPERIRSYELGYVGTFPEAGLSVDLKVFEEEIRDFIIDPRAEDYAQPYAVLDGVIEPLIYENAGRVDTVGAEAQITYRPGRDTRLSLQYGYARTTGRYKGQNNPVDYRDISGQVPTDTASALLSHRFPDHLDASLAYYTISEMEWAGDGDELPGYERLDVRLAQGLGRDGRAGTAELIVQNLLDEYPEFSEDNRFGMRGYLRVTFKL
ncbi:MAG TPA: TonB-dependent receptor, partial [Gammaproteobacteria bacterium]|nr:TonB-dependent receptor [Gammaproteobacteria bacterium]